MLQARLRGDQRRDVLHQLTNLEGLQLDLTALEQFAHAGDDIDGPTAVTLDIVRDLGNRFFVNLDIIQLLDQDACIYRRRRQRLSQLVRQRGGQLAEQSNALALRDLAPQIRDLKLSLPITN